MMANMSPALKTFLSLFLYMNIELFRPIKTAEYIQKFYDLRELSEQAHRNRDWRIIFPFYFFFIGAFLAIAYTFLLMNMELNQIESLIFLDFLEMFKVKKNLYLVISIHILMFTYDYYILFNDSNQYVQGLLKAILEEDNKKVFIFNYQYKSIPAIVFIKQKLIFMLNFFVVFVYVFGIVLRFRLFDV